jgi:hypothetical protein
VFNLPPDTRTLPAGAGNASGDKLPKGAIQSVTDFGAPGYGGPCPPRGDRPHRYVFSVHALEVDKLDLDEKSMPAMVGFMTTQPIDRGHADVDRPKVQDPVSFALPALRCSRRGARRTGQQHTVPDAYPLTLNALIAGCNQRTSRDPVLDGDAEVQAAVDHLRTLSLIVESTAAV